MSQRNAEYGQEWEMVEVPHPNKPDEYVTVAKHIAPLILATFYGCAFVTIRQKTKVNFLRELVEQLDQRPSVVVIGDDLDDTLGPSQFNARVLKKLIRKMNSAVVVACKPIQEAYESAALIPVVRREHSLIVETREEQEINWVNFIQDAAPELPTLICSVERGAGWQRPN